MKLKQMMGLLCLTALGAACVTVSAADLKEGAPAPEEARPLAAEAADCDGTHRYPVEINGERAGSPACVMVPLRAVAEPLGFTVTWDSGSVLVDNGVIHTRVTIGLDRYVITTSNEALVGMSAPFSLGAAPYVLDGVTYVPLGLFNALLGDGGGTVMLDDNKVIIQTDGAGLANPFVSCATLEEAERLAGFSLDLPDQLTCGAGQTEIRAVKNALIEVTYREQGQELKIRKAADREDDRGDLSGDYRVYDAEETIPVNGCEVTVRQTDGKAAVALWSRDGYTYAVNAAPGLEPQDMTALAAGIR